MKLKHLLFPAVLAAALSAVPTFAEDAQDAFSQKERELLRALANDVKAALSESGLSETVPVSTLPIQGDRGRYLESLLKIAVCKAGLNYVEGRNDPMWSEIVSEIKWDELKEDLLDETTLTKFGRLQAARYLVYGRLFLDADKKGRPCVELHLHVASTETKQHPWGDVFVRTDAMPGGNGNVHEPAIYFQEPVASLLTAGVVSFSGNDADRSLGDRLVPIARDALVKGGFQTIESGTADVAVRLESKLDIKDRTADFVAFRGRVPVSAVLPACGNRSLGAGQIEKTGDLTQDDDPALSSLVSKMELPLRDWIAQHVTPEACGLRVDSLTVSYREFDAEETAARIAQFCDAGARLPGVVSCTLAQRLKTGNQAVYRIVSKAGSFPAGFLYELIKRNRSLELVPDMAQ